MNNDLISNGELVERSKRNLSARNPGTFSERSYQDAINTGTYFPAVDAGPKWISVKDRLPEPEQLVLVQCVTKPSSFKYQCLAFYVPKKWLIEASNFSWDYECCNEYDEEADDYYVNEGWYERIYNWDDYNAVGIGDYVTHWMPLPEPPKEG